MKQLLSILILVSGLVAGRAAVINIGTTGNDGQGESIRSAFGKINTNFLAVSKNEVIPYTAHGDDSHDDTAALQDAINTATSSGTYSTIALPPGVYKTTSPLVVTNACRIIGSGYVGATAFSPSTKWAGTMIRYYGTNGAALQIGDGTNNIFRVQLQDIRIGAAGQSPKPEGVYMVNCSEGTFNSVQINGGFSVGLHIQGCTLYRFDLTDEACDVGMLVENSTTTGVGMYNCSFPSSNFYLNGVAHVKIIGNIKNVSFNDSWFEDAPIALWVPPPTKQIQSVYNLSFANCGFNSVAQPNARIVKLDAGSTTNSLNIRSFTIKDSLLYVGASNAVDILFTNNTGPSTFCRGLKFEDIQGYAISNALVYCDSPTVNATFRGVIDVYDAFGEGNIGKACVGQIQDSYQTLNSLGYVDFSDENSPGSPIRLPRGNPYVLKQGLFAYSTAHDRPYWSDGTNTFFSATVDQDNRLVANRINAVGIPVFANNAAAISGGLGVGDFYRSGANPDVVSVVH